MKKLAEVINNRTLRTCMIGVCLLIAAISTGLMAFFSYGRVPFNLVKQVVSSDDRNFLII